MRNKLVRISAFGLAALAFSGEAADATGKLDLKIGESAEILLDGNPSTGYHWRLDPDRSDGLAFVKVEILGYRAPSEAKPGLVGAPAPFTVQVTCRNSGMAHLEFAYVSPAGAVSDKTAREAVTCR